MATARTTVILGGKPIDPYKVSVQQRYDAHHEFEIAVSTEKIEGKNSLTIDNSVDNIGQFVEISIDCATGNFHFKGLITNIHIDRTYTGDSLMIFSGYSPTYMLEDGEGTKSYEEKNLATIVNEILDTYPTNLLHPSVSPQYSTPIPYVVRYKETNYQFLARLAATYGEWFYYDGQSLVFGKLPNPPSITITLGKDLSSFDYGVQMRPSKFKYQFYNYEENRTLENASTSFKPGWLDNYGKKALDAANNIFPNEPIDPTFQDAPRDALIKHLVEVKKSSILSDTASFKGKSTHAGIMLGGRIRAKGVNKINGQNVYDTIGNFRVTSVTHHLDANKNYSNTFEAIPMTVTAPPMNKNVVKPEAESQVAVVIDNNDPEGLGRVRTRFKWQGNNEMTPWIRVLTSSASGGRGMYFIPEIGDEAYIDFDQGNPDRPYVTGTLFHGNARPTWGSAGNDTKALRTRSGNRVELNDANGSVNIIDPSGNTVSMAGNGEITITAPNKITLSSTDIVIDASNNISVKAGNNMTTGAGNNASLSAGNNISEKAGKNMSTTVGMSKNTMVTLTESTMAGLSISEMAGLNISMNAINSVSASAKKATLRGSTKASVSGKDVAVNGSSTVKVESADTNIL